MSTGYFDLETQFLCDEVGGWGNIDKLRMSVGCLIVDDNEPDFYQEDDIHDLFGRLDEIDVIVGHNLLGFDYTVLNAYADFDVCRRYAPKTRDTLQMIYRDTKVRVSLNNLAKNNVGGAKSGNGADMPKWWREGRHEEVMKYCAHDVELTKAVYLFGKQNGYVHFTKYDRFDRTKCERVTLMVAW